MKNQRGFAALEAVLILIIIVIIGGVVWYVIKQNKDTAGPGASTVSKTEKEPIEEYKPTSTVPKDWKIYENKKYKISFAYPGNSKVDVGKGDQEHETGIHKDVNELVYFTISEIGGGGEGGDGLFLSFYAFDLSIEQTIEKLKESYVEENPVPAPTLKEITFQGKKGLKVNISESDNPLLKYYVEHNGYTFELPLIDPNYIPYNTPKVIVDSIKFL